MLHFKMCELACTLSRCLYGVVRVHRGNFFFTFALNHEQHTLTIGFIYCSYYYCCYGHV